MRKLLTVGLILTGLVCLPGAVIVRVPAGGNIQSPTPPSAAISGRVIDADGQPVPAALVSVEPVGVINRTRPQVETNQDGEFTIEGLGPGTYKLHAAKEEAGYAPTDSAFRSDDSVLEPYVSVNENQVVRDVSVHLGHRGAWLVGQVVGSRTNQPVETAQITLRRVDDAGKFFRTGINDRGRAKGGFKLLVPTVPFTIEVSAPGYRDWHYGGLNRTTKAVRLAPGETRKLIVALDPAR
ncbi:MAG TPA: carboxypeptidase-like regulatory domain-containing protein [Pyrinomonadaceae bacterium]